MELARISDFSIEPYFDMEDFMHFSRETRLESSALKIILDYWQDWGKYLQVKKLEKGNLSWLAVWLSEDVEKVVDATWDESPSSGYLLNSLAQYFCMSAILEVLPQISSTGCAPTPKPDPALKECLQAAGLAIFPESGNLTRRYAIITHYPFKGGCEVCNLKEGCHKNNENFSTMVLPGFEKGKD